MLKFLSLTFTVTWVWWIAAAWISLPGEPDSPARATVASALFLLGIFAPGLTAIALTERLEGRAATVALLRRLFEWRVGVQWYVFAIGFMPAIKLLVALTHRLIFGEWPRFGLATPWYAVAAVIATSMWVQAGEEIGWRGYALPRLAERFGLASASVALGVIWATWHLPLFFVAAADTAGQSFPLYLAQVTALSVAMAWLYWRTHGSLLLVMLLHASVNNTKDIVPSATPESTNPFALVGSTAGWLTAGFLWLAAAYFLVRMRRPASHSYAGFTKPASFVTF